MRHHNGHPWWALGLALFSRAAEMAKAEGSGGSAAARKESLLLSYKMPPGTLDEAARPVIPPFFRWPSSQHPYLRKPKKK